MHPKCCLPFEYFFRRHTYGQSFYPSENNQGYRIVYFFHRIFRSPFTRGNTSYVGGRKICAMSSSIFYYSGSSMNLDISDIRGDLPQMCVPDVSKQALSQARKGISLKMFRNMFCFLCVPFTIPALDVKISMFFRLPSAVPAYRCPQQRIIFPISGSAAMATTAGRIPCPEDCL